MTTVHDIINEGAKGAKTLTGSFIKDENIRTNFETMIDAQVAYTKTIYDCSVSLQKAITENLKKYDPMKTFSFPK